MRLIKMLGLSMTAAVVAMAFAGVGTASASEVCKAKETPCAAVNLYEQGAKFTSVLKPKTQAVWKGALGNEIKCQKSTIEGEITENPGKTEGGTQQQAKGQITAASWTECQAYNNQELKGQCEVEVLQLPWEVHVNQGAVEGNGTMWIGPKVKEGQQPGVKLVNCEPLSSCILKAHETQPKDGQTTYLQEWVQLAVTGGNPAIAVANQAQFKTTFLCGTQGFLDAEYEVTSAQAKPIFII